MKKQGKGGASLAQKLSGHSGTMGLGGKNADAEGKVGSGGNLVPGGTSKNG